MNTHETSVDVLYQRAGYSDLYHKVRYFPADIRGLSADTFTSFIQERIIAQVPTWRWEEEDAQRILVAGNESTISAIRGTATTDEESE